MFGSWLRWAAKAEDRVEYRYEDYRESEGRIHIRTHGLFFEQELNSKITARGNLIYDGISGATPTGEPAGVGQKDIPTAEIRDIRRAGSLDLGVRWGRFTTTPQISYSEESDYISRGFAVNQSIDLNQRNTTLTLGLARNYDSVSGGSLRGYRSKETTDLLIGFNQVLGPKTVLTANLTLGYSDGYLSDPYKRATFLLSDSPDPIFSDPASVNPVGDTRPGHRFRQVGYLSLTQFVTPANASVELSYRLGHDDWDVWASTVSLTWFQKIGKYVVLAPLFRFHHQSAASFYGPSFYGVSFEDYVNGTRAAFQDGVFVGFEGDESFPKPNEQGAYSILNVPARPKYFSADYRLSELNAFTYGISAQVKLKDHVTLDLGFKRYEMHGLDGITPKSAYPIANVFTIGCGWWF